MQVHWIILWILSSLFNDKNIMSPMIGFEIIVGPKVLSDGIPVRFSSGLKQSRFGMKKGAEWTPKGRKNKSGYRPSILSLSLSSQINFTSWSIGTYHVKNSCRRYFAPSFPRGRRIILILAPDHCQILNDNSRVEEPTDHTPGLSFFLPQTSVWTVNVTNVVYVDHNSKKTAFHTSYGAAPRATASPSLGSSILSSGLVKVTIGYWSILVTDGRSEP